MSKNQPVSPVEFDIKNKPVKPVVFAEKGPEEKEFLILFYYTDDDGHEQQSFEVITGRTATREFIVHMIESLNIYKSSVVAENLPYTERLSVYLYMKAMETHFNDGFDIEDYNTADYDENL